MPNIDESSEAIGSLRASVKNIDNTQRDILKEIKGMREDIVIQKVNSARNAGKMGVITAIGTFGFFEGLKYLIKLKS